MYGKVKLSKRQIKEDKFTAFMLNSKHQLEENWQYVAIGAIVLILAIVGITYYINSSRESSSVASTQLSQANQQYRQGNSQVAILTLTDIVNNSGSSKAAEQATYMLGKINLDTRNYPEAIRYFDLYLQKYNENTLNRVAAIMGKGLALESQGNFKEAADQLAQAAEQYSDSPLLMEIHTAAMRNYLQVGDIEKARIHYDYINENYGGTEAANRAERLFYEKSLSSS